MNAQAVKDVIKSEKLVPILRTKTPDVVFEIARATANAGGKILEFTMTIQGIIQQFDKVKEQFPGMVLGLGTVYDKKDAEEAIKRGADFIVSPILNYEIVEVAKKYDRLVMLSGFTPTEIYNAYKAGSDIIKLFPASEVSPTFIQEIRGPMPFAEIFPTGGLNLISAIQFLYSGAVAVGMGASTIFKNDLIQCRNFEEVTLRMQHARNRIQNMRI